MATPSQEITPQEFAGTDRFQVTRRIGAGGMGVVYEAVDRERGSRVALKTLRSFKPDALLRFKNEFRSLQDILHPNLVSLGELFEVGGQWFFSMELVRGVHFLDYVRSEEAAQGEVISAVVDVADDTPTVDLPHERRSRVTPIPSAPRVFASGADEGRVRAAFAQLALGLSALHRANKIHRDIKPANILVTPEGRVVILDFGLVTDAVNGLPEAHLVGTFSYMAPEQAAMRPVGHAADWYSVGVLLFQALTGRLPLKGSPQEILLLKQTFEAPAASSIADVPEDLDRLAADLLRIDPSHRPSDREILRRLGAPEASYDTDVRPNVYFVGRRVELDALRKAFETTRGGRGVTMIVHGESGVGKTAMVRRFADAIAAEHPGTVVFSGRCHERESVPYKAVDGIIDALARHLHALRPDELEPLLPRQRGLMGQVFPVLRKIAAIAEAPRPIPGQLDPTILRARLFHALRELLTRLAERAPLVLLIDDLQRADADSLALLAEIMRPPEGPKLLLVATMRTAFAFEGGEGTAQAPGNEREGDGGAAPKNRTRVEEISAAFAGDVRRLDISSLPKDDARQLVAALLRDAGAGGLVNAAAVADEAGGHPLFIDEIVRRKLALGDDAGALRLDEALAARVDRLSPEARDLLAIIAVAGGPIAQSKAAEAGRIAFHEFASMASRLRSQNLVRTDGVKRSDTIEPYHDRVRAAVLVHLEPDARRGCHERLALAIEASQKADPEALAIHWRGAGNAEKAAEHALRAAERAAEALAFDRAARFYEMALELRSVEGDEGRAVWQKLGDARANAGLGAKAADAYVKAAALVDVGSPELALDLRRRAAEQLLRSGLVDEGVELLRSVLGAVGMKLSESPNRALASLLLRRAQVRIRGYAWRERRAAEIPPEELSRIDICESVSAALGMVDTIRGADFQARGLILALDAGEPNRVLRALTYEACYTATGGGSAKKRTDAQLDALHALAQRLGTPYALGHSALANGMSAYLVGEFRRSYDASALAADTFRNRCTGATWERHTSELYAILSLFYLGRLREQARRIELGRREAEERGDLFAATSVRTGYPVLAWLWRGDPEGARREVAETLARWSRRGFFLAHYWGLLADAQIDLYEGDGQRAHARVTEEWPKLSKSLLQEIQLIKIESLQIRARTALAAALTGGTDREGLLRQAEHDARSIEGEKMAWATPLAGLVRAGVAAARGDREGAAKRLEDVAEGFDAVEMALYAAVARARLGELIGGDAGRRLIEAAHAWMAEQGVVDAARVVGVFAPGFGGEGNGGR